MSLLDRVMGFVQAPQVAGLSIMWSFYILGVVLVLAGRLLDPGTGEKRYRSPVGRFCKGSALWTTAAAGVLGCIVGCIEPQNKTFGLLPSNWLDTTAFPLAFVYRIDPLAQFFLILISVFAVLTALYSATYLSSRGIARTRGDGNIDLSYVTAGLNLFLFTMTQVVLADNVVLFLVSWELMTLSSAVFLCYPWSFHRSRGTTSPIPESLAGARMALKLHLVAGQLSTLLLAVGLLWPLAAIPTADSTLSQLQLYLSELPAGGQLAVFVLLLFGFGLKAAMVPFHFWLPWVHPSVPGNAHTLLSEVGVKVGVYGIVRLLTEIFPPSTDSPSIAGFTVLLLGGLSALVGVEYAIAEHDLKRILAYHTVENVGIILMGIGLSAVATSIGVTVLAAVALAMALFHVINHALFKGLLLLATATIEMRTGTVDLDRLGGLFRRMGWTAGFFLVGAVSISALPPFNGFASEWLLLKSLIGGTAALGKERSVGGLVVGVAAFLLLVHAVAYTAFCFTKICGLILAGDPRNGDPSTGAPPEEPGRGPGFGMGLVMAVLAGACLAFGTAPGWVLGWLLEIVGSLGLETALPDFAWHELPWVGSKETATLSPGLLILPLAFGAVTLGLFLRFAGQRRRTRRVWNCGAPFEAASMQADSYQLVGSFLRQAIFSRMRRSRDTPQDDTLRPVVSRIPRWEIREFFTGIYGTAVTWVTGVSKRVAVKVQNGDLRLYLVYLLGALVVIFFLFSLWPGSEVSG